MILSRRLLPFLKFTPPPSLLSTAAYSFSDFFEKQDSKQLQNMNMTQYRKDYVHYKLTDRWKKPMERKARRKIRIQEIAAARPPVTAEVEKLVIHNEALGIEYPPKKHEQFAIIQVDGFQYKVLEDTILILDTKKDHAINEPIVFESVPLVGTKTYTLIGRPNVGNARVEGIVESISDSQKVIVFKKKRRKQYKKSFGFRSSLTQCRITRIVHHLTDDLLQKAVKLT